MKCNIFLREKRHLHRLFGDVIMAVQIKPLFHSSQKPTRKLAARTFTQSQYLKALAASLRVSFCVEGKTSFSSFLSCYTKASVAQWSGRSSFTSEVAGSILSENFLNVTRAYSALLM